MKPLAILIFSIIYTAPVVYSQSIVRSTVGMGGASQTVAFNGKSYFVSQSIGQAGVIGTATSKGYTIRQGFQQPLHTFKIEIMNEVSDMKAIIYPNPFKQSVYISFMETIEDEVTVIVHDISGRIIINKIFAPAQLITLTFERFASGDYILNVTSGKKHLSTSIIKQ